MIGIGIGSLTERAVKIESLGSGDRVSYAYSYKHFSEAGELNGTVQASFESNIVLEARGELERGDERFLLIKRTTVVPQSKKIDNYEFWLKRNSSEVVVKRNGSMERRGAWLGKVPPLGRSEIEVGDTWTSSTFGETSFKAVGLESIETSLGDVMCIVVKGDGMTTREGRTLLYEYTYYLNPKVPRGIVRMEFEGVIMSDEPGGEGSVRNVSSIYRERVDLITFDRVSTTQQVPGFEDIREIEDSTPRVSPLERNDFTLDTLGGDEFVLGEEVMQKPVLVMFVATWCPHCHNETMALLEMQDRYGSEVEFVTVAIDKDLTTGRLEAFRNETGLDWSIGGSREVAGQFGVEAVPTYVLIGKDGEVKTKKSGRIAGEELESELESLLTG